jgi:RNA polymerase sigma-70 factor (ECF subfamily)
MLPLEQILDEHGDAVFSFLLQLSRSEPDARDLFQDLWRRLVENPRLLAEARDPRAFLLYLARNQFIDLTRRRNARTRAHEASQAQPEIADLFEPSHHPDETAFRKALDLALGQLPEDQRTVLHLKLWEGLTFDAIAQLLDLSPNTAASRYRYGVDKLRTLLRPLYDEIRTP